MSRALRYLPEGQMSSLEGSCAARAVVRENVRLLAGFRETFRWRAGGTVPFPKKV